MKTNEEIIELIKSKLDNSSMSMSELASKAGVSKSTLSRYLAFSRDFPLNKADSFAKVLNMTTEEFLGIGNTTINGNNNGIASMSGDIKGDVTFSSEQSPDSACQQQEMAENSSEDLSLQKDLLVHIDAQTELQEKILEQLIKINKNMEKYNKK